MALSTSGIGITPTGTVVVSAGSSVAIIEQGTAVAIGQPETIASGATLALGTYIVQSGDLVADGEVVVAPVTIGEAG